MTEFTDQRGNPVAFDDMAQQVAEAMLANVIALQSVGVPREAIKVSVGHDGGMVMAQGFVFQTPLAYRLPTDRARALYDAVGNILAEYDAGRIDDAQLDRIRTAHNVDDKIRVARKTLADRT